MEKYIFEGYDVNKLSNGDIVQECNIIRVEVLAESKSIAFDIVKKLIKRQEIKLIRIDQESEKLDINKKLIEELRKRNNKRMKEITKKVKNSIFFLVDSIPHAIELIEPGKEKCNTLAYTVSILNKSTRELYGRFRFTIDDLVRN